MQSIHFIGLGAQKSATSWLAKMLDDHPELSLSLDKETHFFSKDDLYERGIGYYQNRFACCSKDVFVGEFDTHYLTSEQAAERIYRQYPHVKLIACLRDPVERARSHIEHLLSKRRFGKETSLQRITQQYPEVIQNGYYGKGLENYLKYFSTNQLLVLWYDDVCNSPVEIVRTMYRFLGVDDMYMPVGMHQKTNTSSARRSLLFRHVLTIHGHMQSTLLGRRFISLIRNCGLTSLKVDALLRNTSTQTGYILSSDDRTWLHRQYLADESLLKHVLKIDTLPWK